LSKSLTCKRDTIEISNSAGRSKSEIAMLEKKRCVTRTRCRKRGNSSICKSTVINSSVSVQNVKAAYSVVSFIMTKLAVRSFKRCAGAGKSRCGLHNQVRCSCDVVALMVLAVLIGQTKRIERVALVKTHATNVLICQDVQDTLIWVWLQSGV